MNLTVDLNSDLGEGAGHDIELLGLVTSASIACGFHAGDAGTIRQAITDATERGVAVGAHPSLFDRENFGRREIAISPEDVSDAVTYQLGVFAAVAEAVGVRPQHVKPHGALYNMATRDQSIADAIARSIVMSDPSLRLFAPGNSALERSGKSHQLAVTHEVFADRNYQADGALVARTDPRALLHDPEEAAARVLRMLRERRVASIEGTDVVVHAETICVHGDTPAAVDFARALRSHLESAGVTIRAPGFLPAGEA